MVALPRSATSFRRQGSSGLIWEDRYLSGDLCMMKHKQQATVSKDVGKLRKSQSVECNTSKPLQPINNCVIDCNETVAEPPSPKLSGCMMCCLKKKPASKRGVTNHYLNMRLCWFDMIAVGGNIAALKLFGRSIRPVNYCFWSGIRSSRKFVRFASVPVQVSSMETQNRKKKKNHTPEGQFRHDLEICTKHKDIISAMSLYDSALLNNMHLNHYHFNALLYICSEALAVDPKQSTSVFEFGFRVFEHMLSNKIKPTEATITAIARLAGAKGDGDLAFEFVKSMEKYEISPRLRSYNPVLICYSRSLDADKAYEVENHMALKGVELEEPEIAALLKVSVDCQNGEKVYAYLHKLREKVRGVSESTADIIEKCFLGEFMAELGDESLDFGKVGEVVSTNGGGWHGLGWVGTGKWVVRRVKVDETGVCLCCGEQLACVDIDTAETEKFAQSVASLAMEREVKSNFRGFQVWLDKHADYKAIVDGANIGLFGQNFGDGGFSLSQLEAVINELQRLSNKWPLVFMHKKRVRALYQNATNRVLLERWFADGVLYETPHGSNDDWYWLYAAVKLKCLMVTNDEMRDHIFELLGSSFFLTWKERHQARFTFTKGDVKLQMPPAYSLVIQESEKGAWHVPISAENADESSRSWLCITREAFNGDFAGKDVSEDGHLANKTIGSLNPCESHCVSVNYIASDSTDTSQISVNRSSSVTGKRKERSS